MERRDFLAALATPTVALLPFYPSANAPPGAQVAAAAATAPSTPTYFWVQMRQDETGELYPDDLITSPLELRYRKKCGLHTGEFIAERRLFVPLETENRFAVCEARWGVIPDHRLDDIAEKEGRPSPPRHRETRKAEWLREWNALPLPTSLVDAPPDGSTGYVEWVMDTFPVTREEAFERAASWNECLIEDLAEDGKSVKHQDWHVVVELGEPAVNAFIVIELDYNGVGEMKRTMQWPIRLVHPTAEETARHPLPEGGVA